MPRSLNPDRFWSLVHAAQRIFAVTSFKRASVADVAAEAGLSTGLVYRYFDGKEVLLFAALLDSVGVLEEPTEFPLVCENEAEWVDRLAAAYAAPDRVLELKHIFANASQADQLGKDLAQAILTDLSQHHLAIRILDRSARDLPRLHDLFYDGARGASLRTLQEGLSDAASAGVIATPPHLPATSRWMLESAVWFGVSRHFDPHPGEISEADALATLQYVFTRVLQPPTSESMS